MRGGGRQAGKAGSHEADFRAEGRMPGRGAFTLRIRLDPESARPDFTMDFSLDSLDLSRVNDALKAYTGTDVETGTPFDKALDTEGG